MQININLTVNWPKLHQLQQLVALEQGLGRGGGGGGGTAASTGSCASAITR